MHAFDVWISSKCKWSWSNHFDFSVLRNFWNDSSHCDVSSQSSVKLDDKRFLAWCWFGFLLFFVAHISCLVYKAIVLYSQIVNAQSLNEKTLVDNWTSCTIIVVQTKNITTDFVFAWYQQVEYIQSSWTQYINTNVQLWTNAFEINCDSLITTFTTEEQAFFSIWTETYWYRNVFVRNQNSTRYLDVYLQWHNQINTSLSTDTRYNITLKRTSSNAWNLQNNSNSISITYSPSSTNNTTVKLFTRWDTPSTTYSNSKIRMYSCTIKTSWTLVRDFRPVYRKSDNVIWLLDIVNKVFYTNQWTWSFTKWWNI